MAAAVNGELFAVAMTGAEIPFTFPVETAEWAIHADGGDLELRFVTGSTPFWKVISGTKEAFQGRSWQKTGITVKGAALVTARIMVLKGLLS